MDGMNDKEEIGIFRYMKYLLIISLLFISCMKENVEVVCTKIYQPVCWEGRTYPNSCYAERDGADNNEITLGTCKV